MDHLPLPTSTSWPRQPVRSSGTTNRRRHTLHIIGIFDSIPIIPQGLVYRRCPSTPSPNLCPDLALTRKMGCIDVECQNDQGQTHPTRRHHLHPPSRTIHAHPHPIIRLWLHRRIRHDYVRSEEDMTCIYQGFVIYHYNRHLPWLLWSHKRRRHFTCRPRNPSRRLE